MPPRRGQPLSSSAYSGNSIVPATGVAPSETTTIENGLRSEWIRRMRRQTASISNGCSGIKITSAPPAIPDVMPIQPAVRPITSHTITRLWLSAVL